MRRTEINSLTFINVDTFDGNYLYASSGHLECSSFAAVASESAWFVDTSDIVTFAKVSAKFAFVIIFACVTIISHGVARVTVTGVRTFSIGTLGINVASIRFRFAFIDFCAVIAVTTVDTVVIFPTRETFALSATMRVFTFTAVRTCNIVIMIRVKISFVDIFASATVTVDVIETSVASTSISADLVSTLCFSVTFMNCNTVT